MTYLIGKSAVADSQRVAWRQLGQVVHSIGRVFRAVHTVWSNFAQAGQLGPVADRTIGRHTGARV